MVNLITEYFTQICMDYILYSIFTSKYVVELNIFSLIHTIYYKLSAKTYHILVS